MFQTRTPLPGFIGTSEDHCWLVWLKGLNSGRRKDFSSLINCTRSTSTSAVGHQLMSDLAQACLSIEQAK